MGTSSGDMLKSISVCIAAALVGVSLAGTNEAGKKFLEENKKKDGVISLASGMQYKVLRKGEGINHPTVDSPCECHYKGTLIDGTQFDSSYDRGSPTTFAPNQVIKGWTEAMQLMVEGDKWEMYIPSDLGYGDRGLPPKIGGGSVLVFTMEIIKINGNKVPASRCDVKSLEGGDEKETKYIEGKRALDKAAIETELARLKGLGGKKMAPAQQSWLSKRVNLLNKLKVEL